MRSLRELDTMAGARVRDLKLEPCAEDRAMNVKCVESGDIVEPPPDIPVACEKIDVLYFIADGTKQLPCDVRLAGTNVAVIADGPSVGEFGFPAQTNNGIDNLSLARRAGIEVAKREIEIGI